MLDISRIKEKMAEIKCCIIIATYNNDGTLDGVIRDTLRYCRDVIVVNDGSTDLTAAILQGLPDVHCIVIPRNTGKGWALRKGFQYAIQQGYRYAITLDSDGQHFPEDIPRFVELIANNPDAMIIGARNMIQDGVPGTSSFGHKFSIFWFRIETGQTVPDVQTGFRLYPLEGIRNLGRFYTKKYEFEVEALVRLAWSGVKILSVPVRVFYAPKESRVSHFRKFRDFSRVSVLNSMLVFMGLLWMRPFLFIKNIRKRSLRELIRKYMVDSTDTNTKLAVSVGMGMFMGVVPIWGWQMMASFGIAYVLKLNRLVTVAASNISLPPVLPFILLASYYTGGLLLGVHTAVMMPGAGFQWIKHNLAQYLVGSIVFGIALGLVSGFITFVLLALFRKSPDSLKEPLNNEQSF